MHIQRQPHPRQHEHRPGSAAAFRWSIALNAGLSGLQLAIGFAFGSLALVGDAVHNGNVKSSFIMNLKEKVQVYFLDNETYFGREGVYQNPATKKDYKDNDERFIFFCRGVLETLKRLGWQPKIIHCNDWQTGLIPMYLKTLYKDDPFFKNVRTIFTAYSLASHGAFPRSSIGKTGVSLSMFSKNCDFNSGLNFLEAGLAYADIVTTVGSKAEKGISISPQNGLEKALQARKNNIVAMTNNFHNGTGQELLAAKFVDVYRDLAKNC